MIEELAVTDFVSVQDLPPIFTTKLAVPLEVGVPVTFNVKLPDAAENVPALNVAVNPKTPVEEAFTALYAFPDVAPVKGKVKATPDATVFCLSVPVDEAFAQVNAKLLAAPTLMV